MIHNPAARRSRLASARLYAITPDAEPAALEVLVAAWLAGGVDAVQLRHGRASRTELLELAVTLAAACARADTLFIVNDHLDVALLSAADGVHLGAGDLSLAGARRVAGSGLLIGASASEPEAARSAERAGADYLGAGPAFATPVKPGKRVIGPAGVATVTASVAIPVFAIGGIDRSRMSALRAAGLTRACLIRGLSDVADPAAEARLLRARLS